MSKQIIRQLKNLKQSEVTPRPEWLKADRARLLSQISNTVKTEKTNPWNNIWLGMSIFLPKRFVFSVVRPIAILLIVTMVGTSGWIATVDASYRSLPGDWLYPAKRVVEKTQLVTAAIIGAKKTEARLHSEFAKRRADEIKTVIKSTDPEVQKRVASVVKDLTEEINSANAKLDKLISTQTEGTAEMAKEVQKNTEQISNLLKEVKDELNASVSAESEEIKDISNKIIEATELSKDTSIKAMEVLVSNYLIGKAHKNAVLSAIDQIIKSSISEVAKTKKNVENTKILINVAIDAATEQIKSNASSSELAGQAKINIEQILIKTNKEVDLFDQKLLEIKEKIENDDLAGVMDLIKMVSEKLKEINKLQDDATSVAQTILSNTIISSAKNQLKEASALVAQSSVTTTVQVTATTTELTESNKLSVSVIVTTVSNDAPIEKTTDPVTTSTATSSR
jgi:hypothetical protein